MTENDSIVPGFFACGRAEKLFISVVLAALPPKQRKKPGCGQHQRRLRKSCD
jgi:hypothetical protein